MNDKQSWNEAFDQFSNSVHELENRGKPKHYHGTVGATLLAGALSLAPAVAQTLCPTCDELLAQHSRARVEFVSEDIAPLHNCDATRLLTCPDCGRELCVTF